MGMEMRKRQSNSLCSKHLKVVTYKNKYFPAECLGKKSQLINRLLKQKRQHLNIDEDTDSEEENSIADQERKRILEQKKLNLFNGYEKIPAKTKIKKLVTFPTIGKYNLRKFLSLLSSEKKITKCEKSFKLCHDHMHTSANLPWTSPSSIMKAVNDCLLTRNWNNLTHLTLFLINLPSERYKPLIRHLCQVVDKLHPVVEDNNLQGQLTLVHQANRNPDKGNASVNITINV